MEKEQKGSLLLGMEFFLDYEFTVRNFKEYAIGWNPNPAQLKTLSNFWRTVFIGSGIDHLMCDPGLR